MANQKVAGVTIVKVNGISIRSKTGSQLSIGGVERTGEYADGILIGSSAQPVGSDLTATLANVAGLDLEALNSLEDDTVLFEQDNGSIWVINGAFTASPPQITGGEVSVHFMGQPAVRTQ